MIDTDYVSIEQVNWAAARITELHPLVRLADIPSAECDAWISECNRLVEDYCGIIGAMRSGKRAWLDVQLASGRWVGRWFDGCASEAAIHCVHSWSEPILAAGVGLKDSAQALEARAEREASGDLLVLLGDDW